MPRRLHARLQATPLRSRLVGLLLLLVAAALLVAGAATVAALRGYLFNQVDRNLADMARPIASAQFRPLPDEGVGPPRPGPVGRDVMYVQLSDATGTTHQVSSDASTVTDPPALPDLTVAEATALDGRGYVVDSTSGDALWRVVTAPLADGSGSVSVAQDISGIDATVNRLILIELAIGALVLVVLGITGRILIRRSLRPLAEVEETAAAIASGHLDRRAPASDPRTEVGSLAHSFNTMVDDLAGALAAQQASEQAARESAGKAQASEARMRQFVADAGHELRTPLTSVRGFAELYRIGAVDPGPPLDDAMSRIEAEAARMGVLVDDLLLLARLDQQRPLEITEVDVVDLVADAVTAARATAPERELSVHVSDPAEGLSVPGDPLRLRQVVDNLVSNALRYSPADQPVDVRIGVTPAAGGEPGWATIAVVDHGAGMPPEVAARAFERFYRADAARSRAEGGSGLGLAIVAAIVAAHGAPAPGCWNPQPRHARGRHRPGGVSGAGRLQPPGLVHPAQEVPGPLVLGVVQH
jgi:two-component system OmpR family sensor kinase